MRTPVTIPNFLKARSLKRLRALMLLNNQKKQSYHFYSTPQYVEKEDRWYVFYEEDAVRAIQSGEVDEDGI